MCTVIAKRNTKTGALVVYLTVIGMFYSVVPTKANLNMRRIFCKALAPTETNAEKNVILLFTHATVKQVRLLCFESYYLSSSLPHKIATQRATRSPIPQPTLYL